MKHFVIDLKKEFPMLSSKQDVSLECFIAETFNNGPESRLKPAMLICPGGAYYMVCADREGEAIALKYLNEGYATFILRYSVQPEHYPEQLLEAAASMLYIRSIADEYKINKQQIAINGYSAGGHLAASLCVFWKDPFICDILKTSSENIRPDAAVLGYPVISSDLNISHRGSIQNVSGTSDTDSAIFKKMSLENSVADDTPPTFIWHTATDQAVPVQNSIAYANALVIHKVDFEMHIYPFGAHGLATGTKTTNNMSEKNHYVSPWLDESIKFLDYIWNK